ncbi:MAG: metal-dependent hydrolase [Promethearchaeota archaeon]
MTSIFTHMAIGILIAELILRLRTKDPTERSEKRVKYWTIGWIAGLLPDLDIIPAVIQGVHSYIYHHFFTHTFLALGIVTVFCLGLFKKNELAFPFFAAFALHLFTDYIDNSISPLGPFFPFNELGLLCGWGTMPCVDSVCGWASEYWLDPANKYHDLWTLFLQNGWGIPVWSEFLTIYDLTIIGVFAVLFIIYIWLNIKKRFMR